MKKRPVIGLLCIILGQQPEYEELDLELEQEIMDLGIDLIAFTPYGISWSDQTVQGKGLVNGEWVRTEKPFPDAIYNRLYGTHPNTIKRLTGMIGTQSLFNRKNRLDKYQVYQSLYKTHKRILPFTSEYTWAGLMDSLETQQQIILKPKHGHYGLDIYRVTKVREGRYELYHDKIRQPKLIFSKKQLEEFMGEIQGEAEKREYLIQQLIEPVMWQGRYFDIRTLVQKDHLGKWQVTASISRVARKNYFATNVVYKLDEPENMLQNASFHVTESNGAEIIMGKVKQIALEVANTLNATMGPLGELGIDFLIDRWGEPWLIEVNGKPRKDLFDIIDDEAVLEKIYLRPLEYAKFLARK